MTHYDRTGTVLSKNDVYIFCTHVQEEVTVVYKQEAPVPV